MKRAFDLLLASVAAIILLVPVLLVAALVRLTSRGPALYWSDRVGRHNTIFRMPKFRSMRIGTPAVATHLLDDPDRYLTPIGSFLAQEQPGRVAPAVEHLEGGHEFCRPAAGAVQSARPDRPAHRSRAFMSWCPV